MIPRANNTSLVIFARFPHPGRVKTRLAATVGKERAAIFYRACAEHVFAECCQTVEAHLNYIFYTDHEDADMIRRWVGKNFILHPQIDGDLGERMLNAFQVVFHSGTTKALVLGTDIPDISAQLIDNAIESLNSVDIVIGPSTDGGYYLLGMKKLWAEVFNDIMWSSPLVFEQTMSIINNMKLSLVKLPQLLDVDTGDDLKRWLEEFDAHKFHPVANVLREHYKAVSG